MSRLSEEEIVEIIIKRIDSYEDTRFSEKVLCQHGAFVVNDLLMYEVEIISNFEAIIRGDERYYREVIDEFRFYAEHISKFYNEKRNVVAEYEIIPTIDVQIDKIQPSQFYVSSIKKEAVSSFIQREEDIIIPLVEYGDRYISMDGHTRLSIAIDKGFKYIKGIVVPGDKWLYEFVNEAVKRNVITPYDLEILSQEEYDIKWNMFCDEFFERKSK